MNHSGPIIATRGDLSVQDCHECGFAHLSPLPDPASLDEFYRSDFWQTYKAGALSQFEIEREWWDAIHGDWLTLLDKHTGGSWLLDVGAGYGYFVKAAIDRQWAVDCIEPSLEALDKTVAPLGGVGVWPVQWDKAKDVEKYNAISALWLIEHLPNPHEFLLWCYDHLHSGGVLLLAAPSDFSAIQTQANRVVKNKNYWLDKTHLNYFTWSSISNLLGRSGFRIVERTTLFPMEQYLLDGLDYTANDEIGKLCHGRVRQSDLIMNRTDRINYYQMLAREGRGREIVCVAVKE